MKLLDKRMEAGIFREMVTAYEVKENGKAYGMWVEENARRGLKGVFDDIRHTIAGRKRGVVG